MEESKEDVDAPDSKIRERFFGSPEHPKAKPAHSTAGKSKTPTRSCKKQSLVIEIVKLSKALLKIQTLG